MASEREISLEIIYDVLENGLFHKDAYEKQTAKYTLEDRGRAFINTLTLGTVERCITLDYVISTFAGKPVNKLKPYIRNILRMSLYQINYMDKVPDSAAVNEAVKLARKKGYAGLCGFVNGLLRNVIRNREKAEVSPDDMPYEKYISIKYSVPEWIVKHYLAETGGSLAEDAFGYFLYDDTVTIRIRKKDEGNPAIPELYESAPGKIFSDALRLKRMGRIDKIPGYENGAFVVQDESSMIPAHLIAEYVRNNDLKGKPAVLDICAAPGGKILEVCDELKDKAAYTACDVSEKKINIIKDNTERLKITEDIDVKVRDALKIDEEDRERYDIVIADLPCSGLGVIAGKPDIKYNTKPEDLETLAAIQKKMLANASCYVKKGGIIVYSTCTINKKENEENVDYLLKERSDYELMDVTPYIPDVLKASVNNGCIKVLPGVYESDGFFVAVLRRK